MTISPSTSAEMGLKEPKIKYGLSKWLLGSFTDYQKDPIKFYARLPKDYGDVVKYRLFGINSVFINSPQLIQSLLIDHAQDYDKGRVQHYLFKPLIGNGVLNSEGQFHQQQRKLMAPMFTPRHLSNYAETMVDYADNWQAGLSDGVELDVHSQMMSLTMKVVSKVLLGTDVEDDGNKLSEAINTGIHWFQHATTSLFAPPLWVPTPYNIKVNKAIAYIRSKVGEIIKQHRNNVSSGDLLSMLLQANDNGSSKMSDEQVLDEVLTFFLAGHETTALALTWTFYLLARHPEVYAKLEAELDSILKDQAGNIRQPTYNDLPRLSYTLQIFKEAMRLYPPSSAIIRVALRDNVLGDELAIRKGTWVTFSQYVLHRRSDNFPYPERFDPERFTPANEQKLPRYAYLPFGAGHRVCIGNHFATMEGQLLMATIGSKLRFELVNPYEVVQPDLVLTLRPKSKIKLRVVRR